jgi:hypothetical protein
MTPEQENDPLFVSEDYHAYRMAKMQCFPSPFVEKEKDWIDRLCFIIALFIVLCFYKLM